LGASSWWETILRGSFRRAKPVNAEARLHSDEERKERENLRLLREKYKLDEITVSTITREHIENIVSRWTGAPIASIRKTLANSKEPHP
jgi:hypothetical protein